MITEHIEYLIARHDCVVVPGWGAFVAQYKAAAIDAEKGIILPPMRSIGFNNAVNHNDALLASSIMRRQKIGYEAASQIIECEVDAMRHQLDMDKELSIGRIGLFSKGIDNKVTFEPYHSNLTSFGTLGLPTVSLPVSRQKVNDENGNTEKNSDVIYVPVSRNILKIAASLLLLLVLGFTLSTPIVLDQESDFASISPQKVTVADPLTPGIVSEPDANAELFIAIPCTEESLTVVDTVSAAATPIAAITDISNQLRCIDNDPYCLIVASLASRDLAEEYILEHRDASMHILEAGGKYRIYVATGATSAQAMAPTHNIDFAKKYPAAWVCRR